MVQCGPASSVANSLTSAPDRPLGNSVGAIGWPEGLLWRLRPRGFPGPGVGLRLLPQLVNYPDHPFGGGV